MIAIAMTMTANVRRVNKMTLYDDLMWRGLIKDVASEDLKKVLNGDPISFYWGTDPTADSLHVGHYSSLVTAKRLAKAGHHPVLLVGGATGLIGDPRPTSEREIISKETLNKYFEGIKKQVSDRDYLTSVLSIERDNPKRIRKDFITWQQTLNEVSYFWDFLFVPNKEYEYNKDVLREFIATFDANDDKDTWWNKIVVVAEKCGVKPGDVAMNLRVAMTGRTNTPDLYSLMHVLGGERVNERINMVL